MAILDWLKPRREPERRRPGTAPPRRQQPSTASAAPPQPAAPAAPPVTHRDDGTPVQTRAPRYRVAVPAVVSGPHGNAFMLTCSLSEGGCGLTWIGPPPRVGGGLHLKLGSGPRAVGVRAAVCWAREAPRGLRVGVRFLLKGDAPTKTALAALVVEARRSGQAA